MDSIIKIFLLVDSFIVTARMNLANGKKLLLTATHMFDVIVTEDKGRRF